MAPLASASAFKEEPVSDRPLNRRDGSPSRPLPAVIFAFRHIVVVALTLASTTFAASDPARALLSAAGNAATEPARLALLRDLATRADRDPTFLDAPARAELDTLLPLATAWAEGRARALADLARSNPAETHRYLHDFFNHATRPFTPPHPPPPRSDSPLYPLWALYRGRFLAWYFLEHSDSRTPERRKLFLEEAHRCFGLASVAFPENQVLRIYTGEDLPIPATELSPADDRAPAWANHQRRALEQLHKIIRWWIAERQLSNGEFGGTWGDDVEMWRWWSPILIGFDDPIINAALSRLAFGNLSRPTLAAGYTSQLTDVEHTAEETADTLTPLLHALGPTPDLTARIQKLLTLADRTWWGENQRGQLQFKHIDFNHERLGPNPARAYDTAYHTRVLQPAFLLWQRTRDPALAAPLTRWLRTWAEAALSTDRDKPAGIVPAALHFPTGRVGSETRGWIGPDLAGDPMQDLYSFPHHPVSDLTTTLLQAHLLTREPLFLEPLEKMAALRRAHLAAGNRDGHPGSSAWAAHRLANVINDALAKYRQLTGDSRFDDLLRTDATGYVQFLLTRSTGALREQLAATAHTLSHNWPMFTEEVRYTDRVLSFARSWPRPTASSEPTLGRVDTDLLYSTVTGDPGSIEAFPLNAVRWHTLPRDFAVLVTENRRDRFAAELYHFGPSPRDLAVTFHTLEPGTYPWKLTHADGRLIADGQFTVSESNRRLAVTLPSRAPLRFVISR